MSIPKFDIAVIGGGIIGMSTAMALTERVRGSLVVLEAEADLATHQSSRNSGVIHSGLYYLPGSDKARACTAGREQLYRFCREHGVRHERCGKIIVAASPHELPLLDVLVERGRANGLKGLRKLTTAEMREREPHVRGLAGLLVPDTGIVDFAEVTRAFAKVVVNHGGEIRTRTRLHRVRRCADGVILQSGGGEIQCRRLINCGGLETDRIARLCGVKPGVRIIPFRGEYHQLRQDRAHLVKHLVYPVPDPRLPFLGVHFTRTIHGGVIAGPSATLALGRANYRRGDFSLRDTLEMFTYPGFWLMARRHWLSGVREYRRALHKRSLVRGLQQLVPEIEPQDVRPIRAGIRAQAVELNGRFVDDFRVLRSERMIHVLNTPSPAATASIAIGRRIADQITGPQVK